MSVLEFIGVTALAYVGFLALLVAVLKALGVK